MSEISVVRGSDNGDRMEGFRHAGVSVWAVQVRSLSLDRLRSGEQPAEAEVAVTKVMVEITQTPYSGRLLFRRFRIGTALQMLSKKRQRVVVAAAVVRALRARGRHLSRSTKTPNHVMRNTRVCCRLNLLGDFLVWRTLRKTLC